MISESWQQELRKIILRMSKKNNLACLSHLSSAAINTRVAQCLSPPKSQFSTSYCLLVQILIILVLSNALAHQSNDSLLAAAF
jgi:hypothetical protein